MPDSMYSAGKGVAFRVSVMMRQDLLSSAWTLEAWADFPHTAAQYSAVE